MSTELGKSSRKRTEGSGIRPGSLSRHSHEGLTGGIGMNLSTETSNTAEQSKIVSEQKIEALRTSFTNASPEIRSLLGVQEGLPDTHFVGIFGSCATERAQVQSDIDGLLFYQRTTITPTTPYLDYDLSHTFDSPNQSVFEYPEGHKPPNPEGLEEIEAHDITDLPRIIADNGIVNARRLKEIAVLFFPVMLGEDTVITATRDALREAIDRRTGKPYDSSRYGDHKYSVYGNFEDHQGNGELTWKLVKQEYRRLFKRELY